MTTWCKELGGQLQTASGASLSLGAIQVYYAMLARLLVHMAENEEDNLKDWLVTGLETLAGAFMKMADQKKEGRGTENGEAVVGYMLTVMEVGVL